MTVIQCILEFLHFFKWQKQDSVTSWQVMTAMNADRLSSLMEEALSSHPATDQSKTNVVGGHCHLHMYQKGFKILWCNALFVQQVAALASIHEPLVHQTSDCKHDLVALHYSLCMSRTTGDIKTINVVLKMSIPLKKKSITKVENTITNVYHSLITLFYNNYF